MDQPRDVAIVGVYSTRQQRNLGRSALSLMMEAIFGALDDAGLEKRDVDGYMGFSFPAGNGSGATDGNVAYQFNQPFSLVGQHSGATGVLQAAAAIRAGLVETVIVPAAGSQTLSGGMTANYTRPEYEFGEWTGSITPAQFAMVARRHMQEYGTTAEQLAHAAATVRNNGSRNPNAVMFNRGPYTKEDVLDSRMVAEPLTLLMCSVVNDGGNCFVMTTAERARSCKKPPVWVLSGAMQSRRTSYFEPPTLDILGSREHMIGGFQRAGIKHDDTDMVNVYDHFSIGIVTQIETLGFCGLGEGGPYLMETMGLDQRHPICPDGGNQSYSHPGNPYNFKIIEAVRQFRNEVPDLCPGWSEGVHTYDRTLCRKLPNPKLAVACGPLTMGRHSFVLLARD